jgi:hypothetical protein
MADSYVVVCSVTGKLEAEMVKMFLKSEGIPAESAQESYGMTLGLTFGSLGKADILVPIKFEQKAKELIEAMENDMLEAPEDDSSDLAEQN